MNKITTALLASASFFVVATPALPSRRARTWAGSTPSRLSGPARWKPSPACRRASRSWGAPLASDAAAVRAGFDIVITPEAVLSLDYDGSFASRVQNNAVRGSLAWRF